MKHRQHTLQDVDDQTFTYSQLDAAILFERTYIAWNLVLDGQAAQDIVRWTNVSRQTVERLKKL